MSYELEGTLKEVFETRTFGKGFTKREFVVTTSRGPDDRYPQHIKMCVVKDKVSLLDRFRLGQRLRVQFDLRGNESNGRYFNEIQAWRVDAFEEGEDTAPPLDERPAIGSRKARAPRFEPEPDFNEEEDFRRGGGGKRFSGKRRGPRGYEGDDDYDPRGFRGGDDDVPF